MLLGRAVVASPDGPSLRPVVAAAGGGTWFDVRRSEQLRLRAGGATEEAAQALAAIVGDDARDDMIIPSPFDPRVGPTVAAAVAEAARRDGVARR